MVKVRLTAAGKKLAAGVAQVEKAHAMAILGALDGPDREHLLDLMAKLAENMPPSRPTNAK